MATIDKIGAILNTEIKNPFKIKARESILTNPFRDSKFDGNTLPFADIFEGSELKSQNKAKMVMSAFAGCVSNFSKRITEPVSAFCSKVKNNFTSAWNYAKNTTLSETFSDIGNSISGISNSISEKVSNIKKTAEINKISENKPVLELEALWKSELESMKGAA